MTLAEGIKEKGLPYWIPGANRSDLPKLFVDLGFKVGVEVGVSWAENIIDYLEAGLMVHGVDPWKDDEDHKYRKIISIPGHRARTIDHVYNYAVERTAKYPNCHLIRKTSMAAARDFDKRSLDFVYIDGNHEFGHVAMDLYKWMPKLKKGGIMAGHDYYSTTGNRGLRQVRYVVDAFVAVHDIPNFWVIGSKDVEDRRDRELSFFFFKHW